MRRFIAGTATCFDEQGNEHSFRYFLLAGKASAERSHNRLYGIRIEKPGGESAQIAELTASRAFALELLNFLMEQAVTPINLPEVLADLSTENLLPGERSRR